MSAHTAGPWKIVRRNSKRKFNEYSIRPVNSPIKGLVWVIARVSRYMPDETAEANCSLIAAAPDLLEALQLLMTDDRIGGSDGAKAKAAISKATGEHHDA